MPVLLQWYRQWVMCTKYYGLQPIAYKFYRCSILYHTSIERELQPPTLVRTLSRNVTAHPTDELTASIKADRGGYRPEGPWITIQYGLRCIVISCVCTLFSPPILHDRQQPSSRHVLSQSYVPQCRQCLSGHGGLSHTFPVARPYQFPSNSFLNEWCALFTIALIMVAHNMRSRSWSKQMP